MLAAGGFAFVFGCFLGCFLRSDFLLPVFIVSGILAVISLFFYKKIKLISVCLTFFAMAFLFLTLHNALTFKEVDGKYREYEVEILEISNGYRHTAEITEGEYKGQRLIFNTNEGIAAEGEIVRIGLKLKNFPDDFGFNLKENAAAKNIHLTAEYYNGSDAEFVGISERYDFFKEVRKFFSGVLYKNLPDYAAEITDIMLLGNSPVTNNYQEGFRKAGGSHFLAVSGLHLSIITSFVMRLLYKLKLDHRVSDLLVILFVVLYMFIAGFRFSVVRSGVMTVLVIISRFLGRMEDSLTSLSFAGLLITVVNPYAASDIGFILSYTATLGIIISLPYFERQRDKIGVKHKILGTVYENLMVSLAASVFTIPVSICYFGNLSFFSLITSLVLAVPCSIIISLGLIIAVVGAVLPPLTYIVSLILSLAAKFILWYISIVPEFAYSRIGQLAFFVFMAVMLMLLSFIKRPSKATVILFASLVLLLLVCASMAVPIINRPYIKAERLGFGLAVEVSDSGKTCVITDSKDLYYSMGGEKEAYSIDEPMQIKGENYEISIHGGYAFVYWGESKVLIDAEGKNKFESDVYISNYHTGNEKSEYNILLTDYDIDYVKGKVPAGNYILTEELSFMFENSKIKFY